MSISWLRLSCSYAPSYCMEFFFTALTLSDFLCILVAKPLFQKFSSAFQCLRRVLHLLPWNGLRFEPWIGKSERSIKNLISSRQSLGNHGQVWPLTTLQLTTHPPTTSEWPQVSSAVRCRTARHSRCREVSLSRGRVNTEAEIAGWRSPRYQPCLLPSVDSTPGGALDVDSGLSPLIPPPVSPGHSFEFGDLKLRSKDSTCSISYIIFIVSLRLDEGFISSLSQGRWVRHIPLLRPHYGAEKNTSNWQLLML